MSEKKTIFQNPIFWVAVGGLGLAYFVYSKKAVAAKPATDPLDVQSLNLDPKQIKTNSTLYPEQPPFDVSIDASKPIDYAVKKTLSDRFVNSTV